MRPPELNPMHRRDAIRVGVSAGALGASVGVAGSMTPNPCWADNVPSMEIIDTNVHLFQWPFRRLPLDNTTVLLKKLQQLGVRKAWAGTFEALLHRDIRHANARLAERCKQSTLFTPIGAVNLSLPDWQGDLQVCFETHQMPGIRIYPNYHGYSLTDPRFAELLSIVAKAKRFLQIAVAMEDTRTQHPSVRVEDVDLAPLPQIAAAHPEARIQLLNSRPRGATVQSVAKLNHIYFDTARVDSTDGVPWLVRALPAGRVMFGSHAPLLIPEAALIRVHESDQLDLDAVRGVYAANATAFAK